MQTHFTLLFTVEITKSRPIQPKHWGEMTNVVFYTESPTLLSACEKGRRTAGTGNSGVRACIIKTRTLRPVEAEFARRLSSREVVAFPRGSCIVWRPPLKRLCSRVLLFWPSKGKSFGQLWQSSLFLWKVHLMPFIFNSPSKWWGMYGSERPSGQKVLPLKTFASMCRFH